MRSSSVGSWDLSGLPGKEVAPQRTRDLKSLVCQFAKSKSRLKPSISHAEFARIVDKGEKIYEKLSELDAHASLSYAANTQSEQNASRVAALSRLAAGVENEMLFFGQWWKRELDERNAKRLIKGIGERGAHFEHMRRTAKYSLPEPQEKIINIMDVTGSSALVRVYDTITSGFEYRVGSKRMGREELVGLVRSCRAQARRSAYKELLSKFTANKAVLGDIYTSVVSEWNSIDVRLRGHDSAISVRNASNDIKDKTVSALLEACKKNAHVFQKYFAAKAKALGSKKLSRYDLYAPVARQSKSYTYSSALKTVLGSMTEFDPKMADMAHSIADKCHIDHAVRRGKRDGAFCSTVSPRHLPYVLLSFTGTTEDVFTLSHELGHAVHSVAASSKSILVQHASFPVSETASTFSEMLLYDSMMKAAPQKQRRAMLHSKLDSLYASIGRQAFFTIFEIEAHKLIAKGASATEISDAYMKTLRTQFGHAVDITDDFANEWVAIPHFYHTPFYCYAYSFGNLMALSLFSRSKREGAKFSQTYLDILAAGGSKKPEDLMASHGFDITKTSFWQEGFDFVDSQVRTLKEV